MPNSPTGQIKVFGYKLDENGIRDRLWKRYFGIWKFAKTVSLVRYTSQGNSRFNLVFDFEGRKRFLKIDVGGGLKKGIKIVELIEFAKDHAPDLKVSGAHTHELIKAVTNFRSIGSPEPGSDPQSALLRSRVHLTSLDTKKAKKETEPLLLAGGSIEQEARLIRFKALVEEEDEIAVDYEYEEFIQKSPNDWEIRELRAINNLKLEADDAEGFARKTMERAPSVQISFDLRLHLSTYLSRLSRYDDALNELDLISIPDDEMAEDRAEAVSSIRDEIIKLNTDKAYNRRQTVVRPRIYYSIVYGIWGLVAIAVLWSPVKETISLIDELSSIRDIVKHGIPATDQRFHTELTDLEFGRSRIVYSFSTSATEVAQGFWIPSNDGYGKAVLFENDAKAIIENPVGYQVAYLPAKPSKNTILPFQQRTYIALAIGIAPAFLLPGIFLVVIIFICLQNAYKKRRYKAKRKRLASVLN